MPAATGYDYGIRSGLVNKGIADSDIGYNKSNGMVTVKGQDFLKAGKNYNGTTFSTEQDFNNAWNDYQKSLQQPAQSTVTTNTGAYTGNQTAGYSPYNTKNPYDTQYNDLLKTLMNQAQNPTLIDVNQIYASPQYAAYQAQAQKGAHDAIRAAQESMGASGFGRSTALGERSQGIQNDANAYLNTQVIPMLMTQAQNERQQQLQNQFAMLDQLANQQGVYDNRFNTANNLAIQQGQLTGNYLNPEARQMIDQIIGLGEAWKTGDAQQRSQYSKEADQLRATLAAMGIDPSLFGANLSTEQRTANIGKAGVKTMEAQQFAYQQARDVIKDEQYKQQFDEDVRRFGLEFALKEAMQEHQISSDNAQLAISRMNAQTSRMNANWAQNENNPDNIYKNIQIEALKKELSGESKEMQGELEGLYNGLSQNQLSPVTASSEIDNRLRMGLITQQEATKMKSFIQKYVEGGSGGKPQVVDSKLLSMTPDDLLKAWETDPTGKSAGRAKFDWRSWIQDPRGYKSGTTYEMWKSQYGPSLGG